jgi:hypothetical protein
MSHSDVRLLDKFLYRKAAYILNSAGRTQTASSLLERAEVLPEPQGGGGALSKREAGRHPLLPPEAWPHYL